MRCMLDNHEDSVRDRLAALPVPDREHFMLREGFSTNYLRGALVPTNVQMPMCKVIMKGLQRAAKPDLAIEMAMQAGEWGTDWVPPLLKVMFLRMTWLARVRAN